MLISEAFDNYNLRIMSSGGSTNTSSAYRYACKSIITYFGNIDITEIKLEGIQKYYLSLVRDHSQGTARNYTMCLKAVIGICYRQGLKTVNPDNIIVAKREKCSIPYLGEHEAEELMEMAGRPMRGYPKLNRIRNVLIIKMLFMTGLRISELCKLNISDVKAEKFVVVGKSKEPRLCFINDELKNDIAKYLELRTDNNVALFVSSQTGFKRISIKTVQLMFRRVRSYLDLGKITPHTMRHSFCVKLLESNVDIRDTATLMGHQSWNTTKQYTHITNNRLKGVYEGTKWNL